MYDTRNNVSHPKTDICFIGFCGNFPPATFIHTDDESEEKKKGKKDVGKTRISQKHIHVNMTCVRYR